MKKLLRKIIPGQWISQYHKWLARYAAYRFKYPSEQLIVIGVTGTKGKSTTCNLIWHLLTQAGYNVGMATTVNFRIGSKEWLNSTKMTMLGRTQLQSLLSDMVAAHCQYAIVETSSEGIKQFRHLGINYDVVVFTNLFPEHLDAHGGFEPYKQAKLELFRHVSQSPLKTIAGKSILKSAVINGDADYADEFIAAANVSTRIIWTRSEPPSPLANLVAHNVVSSDTGIQCTIGEYTMSCGLLGEWNIENVISAVGVAVVQGISYPQIAQEIKSFTHVPGRMELIDAGQPFTIVVDYAYEPKSLELLYAFWRNKVGSNHKLITLISSTGGGRDVWRRAVNGKVATEHCDYVIVTDEDPYDEDPQKIIDEVAEGAITAGAREGETMWRVRDRADAILHAVRLAQPGDVVLLTAKGAEQKMCLANGKKIDWDDREIARQAVSHSADTSS